MSFLNVPRGKNWVIKKQLHINPSTSFLTLTDSFKGKIYCAVQFKQKVLLYSLTFTQQNRDCQWLIPGHVALTKIKCIPIVIHHAMYPARDTLQHVIKAWWKVVWQKAGKTLPVFFFVNEHNNTNTKPQAKKQRFLKLSQKFPEEKQQLVEEKDADNIRKVLCKSFIQWFWELNLCSYKYRVDCFDSLRLFFCCCWSESLEI